MKKILLINQGASLNYGDNAIRETIKLYFESEYLVETLEFWHYESIFKSNNWLLKNVYRIFNKIDFVRMLFYKKYLKDNVKSIYDYVIIGGGELLSSHSGFITALICITNYFYKKSNIYILGVSGNKVNGRIKEKLISKSLKKATKIFVRDNNTKLLIENEYKIKCKCYPDVVFAYNKLTHKKQIAMKKNIIIVSPIKYYKDFNKYLKIKNEKEFVEFLEKEILINIDYNSKIYFAPTSYEDIDMCEVLAKKIKKVCCNEIKIVGYSNLNDYIKLLDSSKKVISCRMHAMILGLINNCNIVPIVFKKKLEVFKDEYVLNAKDINMISNNALESLKELVGGEISNDKLSRIK